MTPRRARPLLALAALALLTSVAARPAHAATPTRLAVFSVGVRAEMKVTWSKDLSASCGGSDFRSIEADNTSAFNCRFVSGTTRWSQHAYGRAIDLNPVENPYADSDGYVSPPQGAQFRDRHQQHRGLVHSHGAAVAAFARVGWGWGGSWSWPKDYQHFSATGT